MKKSLVGIPVNTFAIQGRLAPPRWTGNAGAGLVLLELGVLPIQIPPLDDPELVRGYYEMVSGIIVTGGSDIDPAIYGEKKTNACGETSPERDVVERRILKWALEDNKPVLGICRGCQMINVSLGGTLYQDLPTQCETSLRHGYKDNELEDWYVRPHEIKIDPGTKLSSIVGAKTIKVNSVHHQAIRDLGKDLIVSAVSPEDGIIEAVEHIDQKRFFLGVQCHPEVLWKEDKHWKKLFTEFVKACENFSFQESPSWVI